MAHFTDFPEANKRLGPPSDMTAETCGTLSVHTDGEICTSRWQPTAEELAELNNGGSIWIGIRSGVNQCAMRVSCLQPGFSNLLTPELEAALLQFADRLPVLSMAGTEPRTGRELLAIDPDLRRTDGSAMEPDKLYFIGSIGSQAEHLYAMRQAFIAGGASAVAQYLKPYEAFLATEEASPVR